VAHGSLAELETYLNLCDQLGYLENTEDIEPLLSRSAEIGRMLNGLIAKVRG
jgi:four helix bundle protein